MDSVFNDRDAVMSIIAVLIERLGGDVTITQLDFDNIAGKKLDEDYNGYEGYLRLAFSKVVQ